MVRRGGHDPARRSWWVRRLFSNGCWFSARCASSRSGRSCGGGGGRGPLVGGQGGWSGAAVTVRRGGHDVARGSCRVRGWFSKGGWCSARGGSSRSGGSCGGGGGRGPLVGGQGGWSGAAVTIRRGGRGGSGGCFPTGVGFRRGVRRPAADGPAAVAAAGDRSWAVRADGQARRSWSGAAVMMWHGGRVG